MVRKNNKKIRVCIIWSLIFSFLLWACSENSKKDQSITIQWEENKAVGIIIPAKLLTAIPDDSTAQLLQVRLAKSNTRSAILGEYKRNKDQLIFRPLFAFTRGLTYEVSIRDTLLGEIEIPKSDAMIAPVVVSIYPTRDTVPQNLLKFYIEFSKPMQEGEALQHISLIRNNRDTVPAVFLDLQPELWNNDRTMLTLWLDPGRIKRDLQPNKEMGPPLQSGLHYQLVIRQDWQDQEGIYLVRPFHKNFIAGARDEQSPDVGKWTIHEPKAGSVDPLRVDLHEPLDYVLLKNAVRVVDRDRNIVKGSTEIYKTEIIFTFTPSAAWKPGMYAIESESRLEDNAGNNLNRLFDNDLANEKKIEQKDIFRKSFEVR